MKILIEQEKALHKHDVRKSEQDVRRLLHPTFMEVGRSGETYDYDNVVDMMTQEHRSDSYLHSQDYQCIQLEPSVQLLIYKSAWITNDQAVSGFAKRSSIWVFTGDKWQMKYHQGTPCAEFEIGA